MVSVASKYKEVVDSIEKSLALSDDDEKKLTKAIEDFKASNAY